MNSEAKSALDQPPPIPTDGVPVWQEVIKDFRVLTEFSTNWGVDVAVVNDMKERHLVGVERYGTALQANNGRKALMDAYAESLDLCVYLKQKLMEEGVGVEQTANPLVEAYTEALLLTRKVRKLAIPDFIEKNFPSK